jgi:hypothetical protein
MHSGIDDASNARAGEDNHREMRKRPYRTEHPDQTAANEKTDAELEAKKRTQQQSSADSEMLVAFVY